MVLIIRTYREIIQEIQGQDHGMVGEGRVTEVWHQEVVDFTAGEIGIAIQKRITPPGQLQEDLLIFGLKRRLHNNLWKSHQDNIRMQVGRKKMTVG